MMLNTFRSKKYQGFKRLFICVVICYMILNTYIITVRKSEAVPIALPFVAVPIIKMLIAGGLTFASVDSMIYAYQKVMNEEYYSTMTGAVIEQLQEEINNLGNNYVNVKENLKNALKTGNWSEYDPSLPPEGPQDSNTILNLGIVGSAMIKDDVESKLLQFINTRFNTGLNEFEIEDSSQNQKWVDFPDSPVATSDYPYQAILYASMWYTNQPLLYVSKTPLFRHQQTNTIKGTGLANARIYQIGSSGGWNNGMGTDSEQGVNATILPPIATNHNIFTSNSYENIYFSKNLPYSTVDIYGEDIVDNQNDWINPNVGQNVIFTPIPKSALEVDSLTDEIKIVEEIPITVFEEIMNPYIDKTYQDVQSEPVPQIFQNIIVEPDPHTGDILSVVRNIYDKLVSIGNNGEKPYDNTGDISANDFNLPDLFMLLLLILIALMKLLLTFISLIFALRDIPSDPSIIPNEARLVIEWFKNVQIPGFNASMYNVIVSLAGLMLLIRIVKTVRHNVTGIGSSIETQLDKVRNFKR